MRTKFQRQYGQKQPPEVRREASREVERAEKTRELPYPILSLYRYHFFLHVCGEEGHTHQELPIFQTFKGSTSPSVIGNSCIRLTWVSTLSLKPPSRELRPVLYSQGYAEKRCPKEFSTNNIPHRTVYIRGQQGEMPSGIVLMLPFVSSS